jgi:hypothetical protein
MMIQTHYNRHRYFSPELGRYISADPIGQIDGLDANLYAYVGSNPNRAVDPLGLSSGFISRAAQNFVATNQAIPGIVAPPLTSGISGISGNVAAARGVKTALGLGFQALTNPTSISAAAVAGTAKATAIAWAAAGASWELGVAVGSLIAAIPVPGGPDATVGTFYGDLLFNYLNPPAPACGGAGAPAPGTGGGTGTPAAGAGGGT